MVERAPSSIAILVKEDSRRALDLGRSMQSWLRERGVDAWMGIHGRNTAEESVVPSVDLVLVLGGDGTLISVARALMGRDIPLAGINCGRVGVLARVAPVSWEGFLEDLLAGRLGVEPRLALSWRHWREGRIVASGWAVNDILVARRESARLVSLHLAVNEQPLMELRADGIILATPTGSSGHSRSAGGPLLFPPLQVYLAVAVCSYLGSFPPLVLDDRTRFRITVGKGLLSCVVDGQESHALSTGDSVEVGGVSGAFRMLAMDVNMYVAGLRSVGFIREERALREDLCR